MIGVLLQAIRAFAGKAVRKMGLPILFVIVGAIAGFWLCHTMTEASRAASLVQQSKALSAQLKAKDDWFSEVRDNDATTTQQVNQAVTNASNVATHIKQQVSDNVPQKYDGSDNLSIGAVRLLNHARRAADADADTLPTTARQSDDAGDTTSTVTRRDEIKYHVGCAVQYEKLRSRYNALIGWLRRQRNIRQGEASER